MAHNVILPGSGESVATDDVSGVQFQRIKLDLGGDGLSDPVVGAIPVTGALTDTQLRATPVSVSGTFWQNTQPVSGSVSVTNFPSTQAVSGSVSVDNFPATQPVSGPLTDTQLRATALTVAVNNFPETQSVSVSNFPSTQAVSGPLTDTELRASAISVSVSNFPETQVVSGPLTDLQLRASEIPVSLAGVATETSLALIAATTKLEDSPGSSGDRGMVILAQRVDSDVPTSGSDGDYTVLKCDEAGRLKVAVQPGGYALTTGNIDSPTSTIPINVARVSNVMVHVAGTFAGVNFTFEGSLNSTNGTDGNWFAVQAVRTNANTIETASGAISAAPAYGWELSVNGLNWFRVRATARTSGTANVFIQPGAYATEPIPAAQASATQPVSGTVSANSTAVASNVRAGFFAAAGIWYDDSSAALASNATFTGTARDATVTASATAHANAATYAKEVRACAESDQSGTLWLEISRDNVNWRRIRSVATVAITGGGQAAELVYQPSWRYWRIGFTNGATLQTRFTIGTLAVAV